VVVKRNGEQGFNKNPLDGTQYNTRSARAFDEIDSVDFLRCIGQVAIYESYPSSVFGLLVRHVGLYKGFTYWEKLGAAA